MSTGKEKELITQILAGEREAVRELYGLYVSAIYNFVFYRLGRNSDLAEEAVTAIFQQAFERLRDYDPARGEVYTWLVNIGRGVVTKLMRREQRWQRHEVQWAKVDEELMQIYEALDTAAIPDEALATEETRVLVSTAMHQLPLKYKKLLENKYWHERSTREIAGGLGVTEKAVESMLARAREAFRRTFIALAREMGELRPEFET